jgi:hypothetical protein
VRRPFWDWGDVRSNTRTGKVGSKNVGRIGV